MDSKASLTGEAGPNPGGSATWDTSALLKLYAPELESPDYRQLVISRRDVLAISDLHPVEVYYALATMQFIDNCLRVALEL